MNNKIKKVLILRFGAIGDVVHSTALFRSIKKACPKISIHYATFNIPSLNIQNDPDIEKIWILEGKTYKDLFKMAKELKKEKFDVFLNLQPSIKTKIFGMLIKAKKTLLYKKTFKMHAVENFWRTAMPVFKGMLLDDELKLYINEESLEKVKGMAYKACPQDFKPKFIAFNMGVSSTRQGRRWPIEYWKELAQKIIENFECEIILTGSIEDKEFSEKILDISPKIKSFCGKINLKENTALLSLCDVVVSGDTGPLHIATAVGSYAVGLYGAAPVSRTGPYGKNSIALKSNKSCVPCNRRKCKYLKKGELYTPCMFDLKPDKVFDEIKNLFEK